MFFPHEINGWRLWLLLAVAVPVIIAVEVYEYVRRELNGEGN